MESTRENIEDLKKLIKDGEKELKRRELAEEPAKQMYVFYRSLIEEGFSEEQAFELVKITTSAGCRD